MDHAETPPESSPAERNGPAAPEALDAAAHVPRLSVVGLGASAGGLRALQAFFGALPADTGLTFVVVTHLSPEHESLLAELLQPHTEMPVRQVNARTEMEANRVYVIPPGKRLLVMEGHLDLADFDMPRGRRRQIDTFFRSLAEHHGDGAAIILSGSGSDGAVGIQRIKEKGGLILVQDPAEADYSDMPQSTIATGLVDVVAPVADLAAQLVAAKRTRTVLDLPSNPAHLTDAAAQTLTQLLAHLRVRTGHDFSGYKRSTLLRRIGRRMQLAQLETLSAYLHRLRQDGAEADALYRDLLIHVTEFFRDPEAWQTLEREVIPQLFAGKGRDDSVRVWSVGCATGEEAYGLAMLLREHAATLDHPPQLQIFASDLGQVALDCARQGVYPEAIAASVSAERLARFFTEDNSHYRVRDELRELVLFTPHNLLQDPPFSKLDLVLCRNLLIYLQREVQERVFASFHYVLRPDGYLFLGSAETIEGVTELFETVDKPHRLYQRSQQSRETLILPSLPLQPQFEHRPAPAVAHQPRHAQTERHEHQRLLEEAGPPSLLVDAEYHVLHLFESAGRYLQAPDGAPTVEVLQLVRPELQDELRTALFRTLEGGKATLTRPVPVHFNGKPHLVALLVRPVHTALDQRQAMVFFLEDETPIGEGELAAANAESPASEQQLQLELGQIQRQLQAQREEYETTNEALCAANAELQSTNEEYRSTLEEFETSQEELRSINEELQTVNQELKDKMEENAQAHSDLQNLFAATEIATLFLDRELCIQRYTPRAAALFNLMPSDPGRPIGHLRSTLAYAELETDAQRVLARLAHVTRDVQSEDGRWFQVDVRPYRTVEDKIEGVVVTFVDVTTNKEHELALRDAKEYAEAIVDTIPDALLVLETDLRVQTANDSFYEMFQVRPDETEGTLVYELGNRQWDIPELHTLLEDVLPENNVFTGFEVEHEFEGIGRRVMLLNGRRLDHVQLILLAITDITARKEAEAALRQSEAALHQLNESLEAQVAERTEQVRNLVTQVTMSEQAERHRISQILHDDLQQRLYSIQFQLSFLREDMGDGPGDAQPETAQHTIDEVEAELVRAVEIMRSLSVDLSPPVLEGEGLGEAVSWLATHMEQRHGLTVHVQAAADLPVPQADLRVLLFQIVRELLFNVVKHAGVAEAIVVLSRTDSHLQIEVIDYGQGFDAEDIRQNPRRSHGLWRHSRRLELVGGHLQIEARPNDGTRIVLTCPLPGAAEG